MTASPSAAVSGGGVPAGVWSRGRLGVGAALSLSLHAALVLALLNARAIRRDPDEALAVPVSIFEGALAPALSTASAAQARTSTAPEPPPVAPPAPDIDPPPTPAPLPPLVTAVAASPPPPAEPPLDETRLEGDQRQDPVALSVATSSAAAGGACLLTAWLQAALDADPTVRMALLTIPTASRSTSNAIMLWDRRWVPQAGAGVAGVGAIRTALTLGVRSAPAACQLQPVRGPELMILHDATGAVVLAIGSGEWRWADLLAEPEAGPSLISP